MSELRWILLIAGIALIVALYVFGTRNRKPPTAADLERSTRVEPPPPPPRPTTMAESPRLEPRMTFGESRGAAPAVSTGSAPSPAARPAEVPPPQTARREPSLGAGRPASDGAAPPRGEVGPRAEPHPAPTTPRSPQKIVAIRVTAAHPARFDGAVLREVVTAARFTHGRYDIFHRLDAEGRPIMSLASLLEPGTFDPATMDSAAYPGIAIFTVMPGPVPAVRAFDELLDVARGLAHRLGGQLQDDRGAPLSVQRVFKLREEVVAFERSLGSAGHA
jgi:cell division protein ZipA